MRWSAWTSSPAIMSLATRPPTRNTPTLLGRTPVALNKEMLTMLFRSFLNSLRRGFTQSSAKRHQLLLETLDVRDCPSGGYLLVSDYDGSSVLRYDEATGAFVHEFVPHKS